MTHVDPDLFFVDLEFMLDLVQRGATRAEAMDWLKHDAPRGAGIEPGYIGCNVYFPERLRSQLKERHREIKQLRAEGLTYAAIAGRVSLSASTVGNLCRRRGWRPEPR